MKRFFPYAAITLLTAGATSCAQRSPGEPEERLSDNVSTLVGSLSTFALSTGNTYPAVAMPWGMNFWTPQTGKMGDGWIYNYVSTRIRGFKQTHQPSPWINDYGQFSIMPVNGRDRMNEESRQSSFSHKSEQAHPYYYSVYLGDHDIRAEIAPSERAAAMRFTFPESRESGIVVDAFDRGSRIGIVGDRTIVGYTTRNSGGVPAGFKNWFVVRFDTPFEAVELTDAPDSYTPGSRMLYPDGDKSVEGDHAVAKVHFVTARGQQITARAASSFISPEQAFTNLEEVGNYGFDTVKKAAQQRWDDVLGRIKVEGGTPEQRRTFYSCLYRSLLFPRKLHEVTSDGRVVHYSPHTGSVEPGYFYTDTGFWDTFRSLFPLLNLVYPSVGAEIQAGLANYYRESGFLPEWASPGHRACMVGNNSASVVSDAILKGITPEEDIATLYEAMLAGRTKVHPTVSSTGRLGHEYYDSLGYVPYDVNIPENAARTLEYAYDDWCIAQAARMLGKTDDAAMLEKASANYKNLFDPATRLMRGRNADGTFQSPFNPYKWGDAFTEGNSWHYTWSVFHDPKGLAGLMGGEAGFGRMLDSVFVVPPVYDDSYYGFQIHEITEMIVMNMGNYAHGNQPIQHMTYLYPWAGQPWKTQYWVREVMDRLYTPAPDGYCGDEDNGQTSAWYVFSALGFYPVCPGSDEYIVGSPLFPKATVSLENGRQVVLTAPDNTPQNRYVWRMKINGRRYTKNYLKYGDLIRGAKIKFYMSPSPDRTRGTAPEDRPYSLSN